MTGYSKLKSIRYKRKTYAMNKPLPHHPKSVGSSAQFQ